MRPNQAYSQAQANTGSPSELIVLLYRGAVRFAAKARLHMQNGDIEGAHAELLRAQAIVLELMGALKPSPNAVDQELYALHTYLYEVLYRANRHKDEALVDEALVHLRSQLETWEQVALPGRRPPAAGVVSIDRRC